MEQISKDKFSINTSFFYKPQYLLLVIALVLLNNLHHSTVLYHSISPKSGSDAFDWIMAGAVNVIVDLSVIAFVVYGKNIEAGVFGFFIYSINALFWKGAGIFVNDIELRTFIAQQIYSIMFAYSIWRFSHLIFDRKQQEEDSQDSESTIRSLSQDKEELIRQLAKIKAQVSQLESEKGLIAQELGELTKYRCPDCNDPFRTQQAMAAHTKRCPKKTTIVPIRPEISNQLSPVLNQ